MADVDIIIQYLHYFNNEFRYRGEARLYEVPHYLTDADKIVPMPRKLLKSKIV